MSCIERRRTSAGSTVFSLGTCAASSDDDVRARVRGSCAGRGRGRAERAGECGVHSSAAVPEATGRRHRKGSTPSRAHRRPAPLA
eukprot:5064711-Prymnesium_polylepis.1